MHAFVMQLPHLESEPIAIIAMKKILLLISVILASAQSAVPADTKGALEKATYQLEKYGSIHVSTPLLTSPTNDFHFDLRRGATNYFHEAKTNRQGGASFFEQTVQSFAARVGAQFDPTVAAAYTAELGQYYTELNRYQKKQSLGDEASQAQLLAELTAAGTNLQAIAAAQQAFAARYQAGSNAPAFPTSQDVNLSSQFTNELARPDVTDTFASNKFAGFQGLLSTQNVEPVLDNRSAIIQAAGDNAIESIFYLLGNPKQADQFKKQRLFFGLVTVGVDPGWRTEKGFAAEVVVTTEVEYKPARSEVVKRFAKTITRDFSTNLVSAIMKSYDLTLADIGVEAAKTKTDSVQLATVIKEFGKEPNFNIGIKSLDAAQFQKLLATNTLSVEAKTYASSKRLSFKELIPDVKALSIPQLYKIPDTKIAANVQVISPLSDSQTLDLASSLRRQTEIALSLSVIMRMTGGKGEAEAFEKFAKSRQFDIRTITQLTSVNAFSSDGTFGFQVGPRMQAIGGAKKNNGPESIMERQSFPALLVLGLNNVDFQVKLLAEANTDGAATNIVILEPTLTMTQTRRWQPLDRVGIIGRDWYNPLNWLNPRLGEDARIKISEELDAAMIYAKEMSKVSPTYAVLQKRIMHLQAQMIGGESVVYFDPDQIVAQEKETKADTEPKLPEMTGRIPTEVTFDSNPTPVTLVFSGKNLKGLDTKVTSKVLGDFTVTKTELAGDAIVVSGNLTGASDSLVLKFAVTNATTTHYVLSLPVAVKKGGAQAAGDGKSVLMSYKNTLMAKEGNTNELTFSISKDLTAEQLKVAAEIIRTELEKNKPGGDKGAANVSVNVQAGNVGEKPAAPPVGGGTNTPAVPSDGK